MHCTSGDGCSVTGQFRCQQGHWAFHKVSKPENFCHQNFGVGNFSEEITISCQVYGPRAAIAHHVCFNVANGFGDRDVGKQMVIDNLYGWDTLKKRAFDRIGESPSAAFITQAEFSYVESVLEVA